MPDQIPIAIAALVASAAGVLARSQRGAGRPQRSVRTAPEPVPVEPPYDGATCAYCDGGIAHECRACGRVICADHWPWPAERMCTACHAAWQRGGARRAVAIAALTLGGMALIAGAILGIGAATGRWGPRLIFAAVFVAIVLGTPLLFGADYWVRRRFRVSAPLPEAKLRSR